MTRGDFQKLARDSVKASKRLLGGSHWAHAYYIAGFAVECALKASIAKRTKRHDFPVRDTRDIYTHDLTKLLRTAGLEKDLATASAANGALDVNWTTVKDWTAESRYDPGITQQQARDLINAVASNPDGVMKWIRQRW